jgi:hypothetical protein
MWGEHGTDDAEVCLSDGCRGQVLCSEQTTGCVPSEEYGGSELGSDEHAAICYYVAGC